MKLVIAFVLVCTPTFAYAQRRAPELPPGEGQEIAQRVCATACHDATALVMKRDGESGWRANVERMIVQKGAQIAPGDLEILIRYLSTRLGPGTGLMQSGPLPPGALVSGAQTAKDVRLPAGPGRELVESRCGLCHDLGRIVSIPRKRNEWDSLTRNMIARGPQTTSAQVQSIVDYLATHFLEKTP